MASETQEATTIYPPITPAWTNLALKNEPNLGGDRCDSTSPGMIADERLSPGSASSSSSSSSSPSRMPLKKRKVHYHSTTENSNQVVNESPSNNIREDDDVDRPIYTSRGKVKQFRCKRCPYVAITKANFWNHARTHIRPDKLLACPRCPFVTEYKHHYKFHLLNHLNSKPFKCDKCDYSGVSKNMLDSHMKTHTSLRRFRCSECDFATKYFHQLKLHLGKYDHARGFMLSDRAGEQPNPVVISRDTHRVATTTTTTTTTTSRRRKSWAKKDAQPLRRLADLVETYPAIATPTRWGYERTASDQVVPEVREFYEQNAPVDYSRRCESPVDLSGLGASVPLDLSRTEATIECADEGLTAFDGDVRRQIQCLRAKFEVMQRHAWTLEQAYYSGA